MTFEGVISTLTVVASLATKVIGTPSQIRLLLQTKNAESFSVLNNAIVVTAYVLWTIHGYLQHDFTVMAGQGIGVITSGSLLLLVVRFKWRSE